MNRPEKLIGSDISLKRTIVDAFASPGYYEELERLSANMDLPVIALKSGFLLIPERSHELMQLLTQVTSQPVAAFAGFTKGQTLCCNVEGSFRVVEVEDVP